MTSKSLLLTALAILMCVTSTAKHYHQGIQKIDQMCRTIFPQDEPGASVLIMQGSKKIFDKGYGIADLQTHQPINGNTFFNIASVSKQFTATAILQLEEKGLLSIEDPISKYYPEFKAEFWKDIKLKHLLSHSSGIPDARKGLTREQRVNGDEKLALAYLNDLNFTHFPPGTQYEYINPTYVLLGDIVEKVSHQVFMDYVKDNIFQKAGMNTTLYFDRNHQNLIPNMAHAYEYGDLSNMQEEHNASAEARGKEKNWYEYDFGEETFFATRPDGGIYTSTHQFVLWEKALRTNKVLKPQTIIKAHTPHTLVSNSKFSDYQNRPNTWYGYGWFIEPETSTSPLKIYHTGDNGGFKILAARYPQTQTLILIFANRTDWDRYEVMQKMEKYLGLSK